MKKKLHHEESEKQFMMINIKKLNTICETQRKLTKYKLYYTSQIPVMLIPLVIL